MSLKRHTYNIAYPICNYYYRLVNPSEQPALSFVHHILLQRPLSEGNYQQSLVFTERMSLSSQRLCSRHLLSRLCNWITFSTASAVLT